MTQFLEILVHTPVKRDSGQMRVRTASGGSPHSPAASATAFRSSDNAACPCASMRPVNSACSSVKWERKHARVSAATLDALSCITRRQLQREPNAAGYGSWGVCQCAQYTWFAFRFFRRSVCDFTSGDGSRARFSEHV